jgi:hypothetical protein
MDNDFASDSGSDGGIEENWSQADRVLFGPEWQAAMEHLEATPLDQLMAEASLDGFVPQDWVETQAAIKATLVQHGFVGRRMLVQKGEEKELLIQVLAELGLEVGMSQLEYHRRQIAQQILELEFAEPWAKRMRGEQYSASFQSIQDSSHRSNPSSCPLANPASSSSGTALGSSQDDWMIPVPGKRPKVRQGGAGISREEQERLARVFWSSKIFQVLAAANSPLYILALESGNPGQTMQGAIGSTRGSTMEAYGKCFDVFLNWLRVAFGISWPDTVLQVIDFLHTAGNRPCSPTYPRKFLAALGWMEKVGCWPGGERFSEEELVCRTVAYWTSNLGAGASPLKQAPRYPWVLIASLELYICDENRASFKRLKAWFEVFKAWATLREDDAQHISPGSLKISGEMIITTLMKSKTSGPAKRTRQLPVGMWSGLTLTRSLWLEVGLGLLDTFKDSLKDFLLPRFDATGVPSPEPMSYADSAALTQVIFSELQAPTYDEDAQMWEQGARRLLPGKLVGFWTQHSARATVPTAAQILQIDKDSRNFLGRWSPGGSDDYARGYRVVVVGIQKQVWGAVLAADPRLEEHEILDRLDRWGVDRNLPQSTTELIKQELKERMEDFKVQLGKASTGTDPQPLATWPTLQAPKAKANKGMVSGKGKYLLVYSRNRKRAKLHKAGGCTWTTVSLADCQEVDKPLGSMYNSRCKLCWPELVRKEESELVHSSSDSEF